MDSTYTIQPSRMSNHPTAGNRRSSDLCRFPSLDNPNRPRKRRARELLARINLLVIHEWCHGAAPMPWRDALREVSREVVKILNELPPDPPKRSYYGAKGSTRNPFRS